MAAAEKKDGGRLVVMGSPIMFNGRINIPDPAIAQKQHRYVSRFPGNGELAANSFFWLAHLEPMIAISPAAMDVSRISDMSGGGREVLALRRAVGPVAGRGDRERPDGLRGPERLRTGRR